MKHLTMRIRRWKSSAIILLSAVLLSVSCSRSKLSETTEIAPFKISVMKAVPLPNTRVPDMNSPFLGGTTNTEFNAALVLQITNTSSELAKLRDTQLKIEAIDDRDQRHNSLGCIPIEVVPNMDEVSVQTKPEFNTETMDVLVTRIYTLTGGETITTEESIKNKGDSSWAIEMPAGKPTIVTCIFSVPSGMKIVRVALLGVEGLLIVPDLPQPLVDPNSRVPAISAEPSRAAPAVPAP